MTKHQVLRLLEDDPQKLIDDEIKINLQYQDGVILVRDGWAAGGPWMLLEFVEGPHTGRKAWMEDVGKGVFVYRPNCTDDGFLFNGMSEDPEEASVFHGFANGTGIVDDTTAVAGGGFYPEWEGKIFKI